MKALSTQSIQPKVACPMQQENFRPLDNLARRTRQTRGLARSALPVALCVLGLGAATAAQAFEYGPFSLTGFAKVGLGYVSNGCKDCQRDTSAGRHFIWTDDMAFGKEYGGEWPPTACRSSPPWVSSSTCPWASPSRGPTRSAIATAR
jgi:hypothetical protein